MDDGANVALISKRLRNELGVKGQRIRLGLNVVGGKVYDDEAYSVSIDVRLANKQWTTINQLYTIDKLDLKAVDMTEYSEKAMKPVENGRVDLLLGLSCGKVTSLKAFNNKGGPAEVVERLTALGWTVSAYKRDTKGDVNNISRFNVLSVKEEVKDDKIYLDRDALHDQLQIAYDTLDRITDKSWEVDDFGADNNVTAENKRCLETLKNTYKVENGRVCISPLWKPGQPEKGLNNFSYALVRLRSILKDNLKTQESWDQINTIFEDYLSKGITREVPPDQIDYQEDSLYWPHFPVFQEKSETTKCRPVMDGAAPCLYQGTRKVSINKKLYEAGPSLFCRLTCVLTRMRKYNIAFSGDISKMFLMINVPEKDRKFQRFIWVQPDKVTLRVFEFTGHVFGNLGSPCCSVFAIMENARRNQDKEPRAAETVLKSTIMDDHLDSAPTEEEALEAIEGLIRLYKPIGLEIAKFYTNNLSVNEKIPKDVKPSEIMFELAKSFTEMPDSELESNKLLIRTLGQLWNMKTDMFTFRSITIDSELRKNDKKPFYWNKNTVLSQIAKVFDPLGYLTPIMIKGKLLYQSLFTEKYEWLDPLRDAEMEIWEDFVQNLPQINLLTFPRILVPGLEEDWESRQMHVFCDASQNAYAAVAYIVTKNRKTGYYSNFEKARNKIKPRQHKRTIPQLELMAIEFAISIIDELAETMDLSVEKDCYIWSDSKTALQWLRMDPETLTVLCRNHVLKIRDRISTSRIKWVSGSENPADYATKYNTVKQLLKKPDWTTGPSFLLKSEEHWPKLPELEKSNDVMDGVSTRFKVNAIVNEEIQSHILHDDFYKSFAKHGCFSKTRRIFGYVLRFYFNLKRKVGKYKKFPNSENKKSLSLQELKEAEKRLVYYHQNLFYAHVIKRLRKNIPLHRNFARFRPLIVDETLPSGTTLAFLRLGGRIKDINKSPYLLHFKCSFVKSLIRFYHEKVLLHTGGIKCLLCELNKFYYVAGSVSGIKAMLRNCVFCNRRSNRPRRLHQIMSPLPDVRIPDQSKLNFFENVALDLAGPFQVKATIKLTKNNVSRNTKRWMLIVRCLSSGAMYLTNLSNISTDEFVNALQRLQADRRRPKRIFCDRGTNFVGYSNEISEILSEFAEHGIQSGFEPIEFHFSPPYCPHYNGVIERMVGLAKDILSKIMPTDVKENELETIFKQVQYLLNCRPIGYTESELNDVSDPNPVTPNMLLNGSDEEQIELLPDKSIPNLAVRSSMINDTKREFWNRLTNAITPKLMDSTRKWYLERDNLAVGDVVALIEDRQDYTWPIGRIVEVIPSKDNLVRQVKVRLSRTKLDSEPKVVLRNITHLTPLLRLKDLIADEFPLKHNCSEEKPINEAKLARDQKFANLTFEQRLHFNDTKYNLVSMNVRLNKKMNSRTAVFAVCI